MRNIAKCKLCNDTIESFHSNDYILCKCGEIAISGGQNQLLTYAKNWDNFLRIDDDGNEIQVKVQDEPQTIEEDKTPLLKTDKLEMLKGLIDSYDRLPQHAMLSPITQADMAAALLLIYEILKD